MDNQDEKDPKNWTFRTFYYNKKDKRVWADRHKGPGTTLNMANKTSYLFLAAILFPPLVLVVILLIVGLIKS